MAKHLARQWFSHDRFHVQIKRCCTSRASEFHISQRALYHSDEDTGGGGGGGVVSQRTAADTSVRSTTRTENAWGAYLFRGRATTHERYSLPCVAGCNGRRPNSHTSFPGASATPTCRLVRTAVRYLSVSYGHHSRFMRPLLSNRSFAGKSAAVRVSEAASE